jgi:hypothetical protein
VNGGRVQGNHSDARSPRARCSLRTPFDRFEGANGEAVDTSWLKCDAVRSALALVAFGVTGYLAWLHGDVVPRPIDGGSPVVAIDAAGARPARGTP